MNTQAKVKPQGPLCVWILRHSILSYQMLSNTLFVWNIYRLANTLQARTEGSKGSGEERRNEKKCSYYNCVLKIS